VFAVQLPAGPINAILRFAEGMGETGETYIVGNDLMMRSQSRFSKDPTLLTVKVDTPSVRKGIAGLDGSHVIADYRGVPVLSHFSPIEFGGPKWVLLAEIDEAEVVAGLDYWPALIAAAFAALAAAIVCHLTLEMLRRA